VLRHPCVRITHRPSLLPCLRSRLRPAARGPPVPFSRAPSLSELDHPPRPTRSLPLPPLLSLPPPFFFLHVPSFAAFLFQFVLCLPFFRFSSPSTLTLRPLPLPRFFLCCSVRAPLSSPYPSGRSSARFHLCGVCRVQRGWSVVGQGRWELWRTLRRGAAAAGQVGGRGRGLTPHLLTLTLSVVFILTTSPTATPFFSPPLFFCCFRPRRKQCDTGDCRPMPSDTIAPFK